MTRRHLDLVARVWSIGAFVAWVALLAAIVASTTNVAHAASAGGATGAESGRQLEQRRSEPQTSVDEVSRGVMCPSCEGTLEQSDSPAADSMREWIADAVAAGWTEEEIRDGLVAEYDGDESILATPRAEGLGLAVWVVPAVVVLLAALGGAIILRSWRRPQARDASSGSSQESSTNASSSPEPSSSSSSST